MLTDDLSHRECPHTADSLCEALVGGDLGPPPCRGTTFWLFKPSSTFRSVKTPSPSKRLIVIVMQWQCSISASSGLENVQLIELQIVLQVSIARLERAPLTDHTHFFTPCSWLPHILQWLPHCPHRRSRGPGLVFGTGWARCLRATRPLLP